MSSVDVIHGWRNVIHGCHPWMTLLSLNVIHGCHYGGGDGGCGVHGCSAPVVVAAVVECVGSSRGNPECMVNYEAILLSNFSWFHSLFG